ncbi:hypothetical protein OAF41_00425 [bacterium]|nr:hypothetical protein [bacterium]
MARQITSSLSASGKLEHCIPSALVDFINMRLFLLISAILSSSALARYYEFNLTEVNDDRDSYGIPEGHEVYLLDVDVPWGLIAVYFSYDPADSGMVTISTQYLGIAQAYQFYAIDSPTSDDRLQISSNAGDDELSSPFTISSGDSQFITFESEILGEAGWVQIAYDKDEGLSIISQNENPTPREPEIPFGNGRVFVTASHLGIIQQSSDLRNWTNVSSQGGSVTLIMSQLSGPVFFRELCP